MGSKMVIIPFLFMILGIMSYLIVTGAFLSEGALPFFTGMSNELGITVHDLGLAVAVFFLVILPLILVPTVIIIRRMM